MLTQDAFESLLFPGFASRLLFPYVGVVLGVSRPQYVLIDSFFYFFFNQWSEVISFGKETISVSLTRLHERY